MAKSTNTKDRMNKVIMNAAMAFGGGVGAEIVGDLAAKYTADFVAENPKLAEGIPAAVGLAGLYFMNDEKYDPIWYGMIGASGAGLGDDIIQMSGFGRTKGRMNGTDADELQKGIEYIEKLQKVGFEGAQMNGNGPRPASVCWG